MILMSQGFKSFLLQYILNSQETLFCYFKTNYRIQNKSVKPLEKRHLYNVKYRMFSYILLIQKQHKCTRLKIRITFQSGAKHL